MNYLELLCFSRILATNKETNIVQNMCLMEQLFLSKITVWNFSFVEVCMQFLILHTRIESLKESRVVDMESFLIELIEAIGHKCSKKHPQRNTTSDNRV